MKRRASKRGWLLLTVGLALLLAAGGWYFFNRAEDALAEKKAATLLEKFEDLQAEQAETDPPTLVVEGNAFCGKLTVETLGIELPVYDEWSDENLRTAPCRYAGSIHTDDLIVAAHNYKSHFRDLKRLKVGDGLCFTDAGGTVHRFTVKEIATLDGTAVSDMKAGDWDFTLFTCTVGGEQRVTVRCTREKE